MKSILSKPLYVTITALVVAGIAAAVILPMVGNPPSVAGLAAITDASALSASSSPLTGAASGAASPIQLSFQASGRVSAVNVAVGDAVTKGQTLATLDASVALGAVNQAKAALDLAKAQYSSISLQYSNAQVQQDTLVNNAYRTLLSSGLQARPTGIIDESHNPTVSGTYTCDKQGSYEIDLYGSGATSGYSFTVSGLEKGGGNVTYGSPQALGTCGLYVTFVPGFSGGDKWLIEIPNTQAASYQTNKNAYDLAVSTRQQTLSQLAASIGEPAPGATGVNSPGAGADTASAAISVAESAYQSALAQYANTIITAPADGRVTFIDSSLKVGQSVSSGQRVMTMTTK